MAKKAFKRLRIAAPWRAPKLDFCRRDAGSSAGFTRVAGQTQRRAAPVVSRQSKINLPLLIWARSAACFPALRPTRKGIAGRWPTFAFARDRNAVMAQRFRKIM
jgi:hypothetical protein